MFIFKLCVLWWVYRRWSFLKKLLTILLAFAIVLGFSMTFVACSSGTTSQGGEERYVEEDDGGSGGDAEEGADENEGENKEDENKDEQEEKVSMPSADELMAWSNFKDALDLSGYEKLIHYTLSGLGVEDGTIEAVSFAINGGPMDKPEPAFLLTIVPKGEVNVDFLKSLANYVKENYGIEAGDGFLYLDNDMSTAVEGTTKDYSMYYMAMYDKQRKVVMIHLKKRLSSDTPFGFHFDKIHGEQWGYIYQLVSAAGIDGTEVITIPLVGGNIHNNEGEIMVTLSKVYPSEEAMKSAMKSFAAAYGGEYSDMGPMVRDVEYKGMNVTLSPSMGKDGMYPLSMMIYFTP